MQHGMKQPMLRVTTPSPAYIGVRLTYKTGATALLWGMSAMPDCTDLPDDPTALARIAVNGSESQDLRNAACQKLIPIINRIAIYAARAYHCQEVEGEAVSHIWQKLQQGKFESEKGRFDSWASVVLHHLAADLRKQFSRRLLHSAQQIDSLIEEIPDGRATGTGAAGDAFAQQLDRLPSGLDPGATARSRPIPEQRPTKGARGGRPRRRLIVRSTRAAGPLMSLRAGVAEVYIKRRESMHITAAQPSGSVNACQPRQEVTHAIPQ